MTRGRAGVLLAAIALSGVALRLLALPGPGFVSDVGTFQAWAERLAASGPRGFYEPGYFADYPPGYLYVLWLIGALFEGEALRLVVKAISIPFDVGIALLLAAVVTARGGRTAGVAAAAIWLLAPAPIVAGPFWGQVDSVGTLPLLASLVLAGRGRWTQAGVLAGVAAMIKPQFGIGALVLTVAAVIELRRGDPRALRAPAAAALAGLALGLPFGVGPLELVGLVRDAAANYPYTSLYAFNLWALLGGFWQPDDPYVAAGAVLLAAGLVASCLPLRRSRGEAALLAAGGLATMAFYFLPTRAHERYLFPAFALLLPLVLQRRAALGAHLTLFVAFALTLLYAITRYPQNGVAAPDLLERTVFTELGSSALHVVVLVSAALLVDLLVRREPAGEPAPPVAPPAAPAAPAPVAPPALDRGDRPRRGDLLLAFAVALAMLVTRGYRLDEPRDMYFDEVYHARTAFELLAEREPYEWTHPHLAKQIMAIGILLFGGDRVTGREALPAGVTALTVSNDGVRAFATGDRLFVRARAADSGPPIALPEPARALAIDADRVLALGPRRLVEVPLPSGAVRSVEPAVGDPVALHLAAGRVVVGGSTGVAIYSAAALFEPSAPAPVLVPVRTVALTGRPDATEVYVLDDVGVVRVLDGATGGEKRRIDAGRGTAIAYAGGPDRLLVASAAAPEVAVISLEGGGVERVPLANARTGSVDRPAGALASVPRSDIVYAATGDRVVAIEPHGASPFATISAPGSLLAVDGEGDELLVAGADGAVSRLETGRHALAWRLPGVVAGALLAFMTVLLARRLFAAPLVAILAGIAVLLDGSMFAQPRIGMNDVYLAMFIVAGWYFVVAAHGPRRSAHVDLLLGGVCFGLAVATKWAGVYALAGMLVACVGFTARAAWRERPGRGGPLDLLAGKGLNAAFLFAAFAIVPAAIYWLSYREWFGGPTVPYGWDLVELTRQMYLYHSGLTSPHPAGSPWWSWPLVLKPVYWYYGSGPGTSAVIYDAGNVVLFWAALPATVWLAITAIRTRSVRLGFIPFAMVAQLAAWIPITRVLFFYHFFTALPFYLLALAVALSTLWTRGSRTVVIALMSLAGGAFLFFYAFVSGLPVPVSLSSIFFVLPTWQYDCQFYPSEGAGFRCDGALGAFDAGQVLTRVALLAIVVVIGAAPFVASRLRSPGVRAGG